MNKLFNLLWEVKSSDIINNQIHSVCAEIKCQSEICLYLSCNSSAYLCNSVRASLHHTNYILSDNYNNIHINFNWYEKKKETKDIIFIRSNAEHQSKY